MATAVPVTPICQDRSPRATSTPNQMASAALTSSVRRPVERRQKQRTAWRTRSGW
ncbi:hypothetical protein D3C71_2221980 [compost metagenome]